MSGHTSWNKIKHKSSPLQPARAAAQGFRAACGDTRGDAALRDTQVVDALRAAKEMRVAIEELDDDAVTALGMLLRIHLASWETGQERPVIMSNIEWTEAEQRVWTRLLI